MGTRRPGYSRVVTTYSHGPISGSSLHREIPPPSTRKRIDAGGANLPKGGATTSPSLLSPTRSLLQTAVAVAAARRSVRLVRAGVRSYSFSFCAFASNPTYDRPKCPFRRGTESRSRTSRTRVFVAERVVRDF